MYSFRYRMGSTVIWCVVPKMLYMYMSQLLLSMMGGLKGLSQEK